MTASKERERAHNVITLLEANATEHPDRVALIWPPVGGAGSPGRMTYLDLTRATEAVAAGLEARGLGPGDRVFLFVPMSPYLYISLFAILRLGAVAIFLDSWARKEQLALCAQQVDPKGFVGPDIAHQLVRAEPAFGGVDLAVRVGPGTLGSVSLEELMAAGGSRTPEPVTRDTSALVTFTTGSSGIPKGADRTHGFLAAQHEALDANLPYEPEDIDLPVFPVFSLNNLAAGVTTVLPDIDLARPSGEDGSRLLSQIELLRVTCSTLSPSLLRGVIEAASRRTASTELRRVVTGGAPIGLRDAQAFERVFPEAELHILYGSTEVEPIAHLLASDMPAEEVAGVCLGKPSPALAIRFVRPHRGPIALGDSGWAEWEVEPGAGGELLVTGAHVCPGYFRNPEAFARAKVVDSDGTAWHRTGDVCRLDGEGRLWMMGRVHNAVHRAGEALFPVEPELLMNGLDFVDRAAYIGVSDAELGEAAWAVFVTRAGAEREDMPSAVRSALQERGIVVDRVVQTTQIPMDPRHHSKVDVDALREQLAAEGPLSGA